MKISPVSLFQKYKCSINLSVSSANTVTLLFSHAKSKAASTIFVSASSSQFVTVCPSSLRYCYYSLIDRDFFWYCTKILPLCYGLSLLISKLFSYLSKPTIKHCKAHFHMKPVHSNYITKGLPKPENFVQNCTSVNKKKRIL